MKPKQGVYIMTKAKSKAVKMVQSTTDSSVVDFGDFIEGDDAEKTAAKPDAKKAGETKGKAAPAQSGNNELTVLNNKFTQILQSLEYIDQERENIKEFLTDIQQNHQIKKSTAKKVAMLLHKNNFEEEEQKAEAVYALYKSLKVPPKSK